MRTYGWFKEFSEDIQVTVVTRKWAENRIYEFENYFEEDKPFKEIENVSENKEIIKVPNRFNIYFKIKNQKIVKRLKVNKLMTFFELLIRWLPFTYFDNERELYKEARNILKKEKFDFVLTSGEPFVLFKFAYLLQKEFNVKIALDYRDGFSTNAMRNLNPGTINKLILKLDRNFERKILDKADNLLFVSNQLMKEVLRISKINQNKCLVVNNGINSSNLVFSPLKDAEILIDKSKFNIVFIGTLYKGHNVHFLYEAFKMFKLEDQKKICFHFVGSQINCPAFAAEVINKFLVEFPNSIKLHDYLPNEICRSLQFYAQLLIKFNAFEQKDGHFGKKMYEYAMSGNKVLSINKEPNFLNYLNFFDEKPFFYYCNSSNDVFENILKFKTLWEKGEPLSNMIDVEELLEYSTEIQTKKIENLFKN